MFVCVSISRVSYQNGVSRLYIMLEIYHPDWKPSIRGCVWEGVWVGGCVRVCVCERERVGVCAHVCVCVWM